MTDALRGSRSRCVTALATACLLIASLGITARVDAMPAAGCEEEVTWSYGERRIVARFRIDLPRCWRGGAPHEVRAWIERSVDPTYRDVQRAAKRVECDPSKVCRVRVVLRHPSPEVASYRLSIDHLRSPGGAAVTHRMLTCYSSPAAHGCRQG